jgi:hypothetical protein
MGKEAAEKQTNPGIIPARCFAGANRLRKNSVLLVKEEARG